MVKTIAVGSASPLKIAAVCECYPKDTVLGYDVSSGVPEQPCGLTEILRGADNRAKGIYKKYKHADIFIGIESGMIKKKSGKWFDIAAIVIRERKGDKMFIKVKWTDTLMIPEHNLERALDGNDNIVDNWSTEKDPHLKLVGRSRKDFIVETIKKSF